MGVYSCTKAGAGVLIKHNEKNDDVLLARSIRWIMNTAGWI